ncbi:MAG: uroporphyrinogen-III synthase [Tepidamorphaceae bacterium]
MRIVLTRPEEAPEKRRKALLPCHEVLLAPALEIRMLPFALPDEDFQAVAVTSVNGARALSAALCGHREETWRQRRIYAVGERTAQAAREAGWRCCDAAGRSERGGACRFHRQGCGSARRRCSYIGKRARDSG